MIRVAGLGSVVVGLVAATLTVPLAAPAAAATPTEKAFVVESVDGDYWAGLYTRPVPTGGRTAVVPDPSPVHIYSISSSADGSRVIYVQINYSPTTGAAINRQVIVRDVSTRFVRVLDTVAYDANWYVGTPVLSPDGTKAAWWLLDRAHERTYMRKAAVGYGGFATLSGTLTPYAFLDNTTLLAQDWDGHPYTIPFSGGTTHPVTGLPVDAFHATVSPDGTKLAYSHTVAVPAGQPYRATMNVASLTLVNGVATVGAPTIIGSGAEDEQPSFSRDGTKVYWVRFDGTKTGKGDIWVAPADGSGTAAVTVATGSDERDVAIAYTDDGTPPAAPGAGVAFTPSGTSATIRWTLPADADLSGVVISRTGRSWFVAAPNVAAVDTGLRAGNTYTYTIQAVDRSGNLSTGATRQMTAIKPGAWVSAPTSSPSSRFASFPVRFAIGGSTFYVQYKPYGGTWKYWVSGAHGDTRTFGAPAEANVAATTALVGGTYQFSVRAVDAFGNSTAWTGGVPAVVPYDQTKATLGGGTTYKTSYAYLGSFVRLSSTKQYAKVTLVGNRFWLVGSKCNACGDIAIYEGSTKIATVNTNGPLTPREVLFTKTYRTIGTHTYTIRPLAVPGKPTGVHIDAFAMRRS